MPAHTDRVCYITSKAYFSYALASLLENHAIGDQDRDVFLTDYHHTPQVHSSFGALPVRHFLNDPDLSPSLVLKSGRHLSNTSGTALGEALVKRSPF